MAELSILIPARNEPHLQRTIEDIFEHAKGDTEVKVACDGYFPLETVEDIEDKYGDKAYFHYFEEEVGQRAATNELARHSEAKYVMKLDAHCSLGPGFDVQMMAEMDGRTILAPQIGVLDPVSWTINGKKMTTRYCFDRNFVMQFDEENDDESMCLQGCAWMIERENYWKWNVCDESLGSWGGQAAELGIAAWLNGGRCRSTKETYVGHVFRHTDNEFPYDRGDDPGKFATQELKRRYENDSRIHELVKRFNYPADWR